VGAEIVSHVFAIGSVSLDDPLSVTFEQARDISADAPLHCADSAVERAMIAAIDRAREAGDTMGGSFEVIVRECRRPRQLRPVGPQARWTAGSGPHVHSAIKAVGIGRGPAAAASGSRRPR
jgi:chorismate synthase